MVKKKVVKDKINLPDIEKEIKEEIQRGFKAFKNTLAVMSGDAPISVLCLPKQIENALIQADCFRVYDLLERDLTKIKRLGPIRLRNLTSRLDEFFAVGR